MNRIESLRQQIDQLIAGISDNETRRCALIHLYGVSQFCALLAKKRGIHEELAAAAGMLHDLVAYTDKPTHDHAEKSAIYAKEMLLSMGLYSADEITSICLAIANHSDKSSQHDPLSELLKDADVLQHAFYDPAKDVKPSEKERYLRLLAEFSV